MTKILVADDESAVRHLVRAILAEDRPDWEVVEATDGVQALQLALLERPSLALIDLHMSALDGIAVCRAIKADPVARAVTILIFTGSGDMEAVGQALDAGADGFLRKPLSVQDLLEALEALRPE